MHLIYSYEVLFYVETATQFNIRIQIRAAILSKQKLFSTLNIRLLAEDEDDDDPDEDEFDEPDGDDPDGEEPDGEEPDEEYEVRNDTPLAAYACVVAFFYFENNYKAIYFEKFKINNEK